MRILFTGASSFTGYWFAKSLAEAGHQVNATFRKASAGGYTETRGVRVSKILDLCEPLFSCSFGDDQFIERIQHHKYDLVCHHAADVTNYKSPEFDIDAAVANNTFRAIEVTEAIRASGCGNIIITGSVFERDEGQGLDDEPLISFSPYGESKAQTADVFQKLAAAAGITLGKFVVPNPYGPYEEIRFTSWVVSQWMAGKTAQVSMPDYERDNIPVSLLAKAYAEFAGRVTATTAESDKDGAIFIKHNPNGDAGKQGAFTQEFAKQLEPRLGIPCRVELLEQQDFSQPMRRYNTDELDHAALGFSPERAWDELAAYYLETFGVPQ
jgi:UDP-glucose 4-epimerase